MCPPYLAAHIASFICGDACHSFAPAAAAEDPEEDLSFIYSLFDMEANNAELDSFLDTLTADLGSEGSSDA